MKYRSTIKLFLTTTFFLSGIVNAQSWSTIANERQNFEISGTKNVRYGIGKNWVYKNITGKSHCSNQTFGYDPAYGKSKFCQIEINNIRQSETVTFSSTTMEISNPDRGFYGWSADYLQNINSSSLTYLKNTQGLTLTLSLIDLSAYRGQLLPQNFLDNLNAKFDILRQAGIKAIIRPVYNYNSSGQDATLSMVLEHINQLSNLFEKNKDVIAFIQAGYIGAWGEWHSSQNNLTSDNAKKSIKDALLKYNSSYIQFRYPYDIIKWYPQSLSNINEQSRVSLHNDCFMSSPNDVGTYRNNSLNNNSEREYSKKITDYTPYGGETCSGFDSPRKSCTAILSEGAAYHLTYLNINFDSSFIEQWKKEGCYAQVMRSLGYRLQLDSMLINSDSIEVSLRNIGWARAFGQKKLNLLLIGKNKTATIEAANTLDALESQANQSTTIKFNTNMIEKGEYSIALSIPNSLNRDKKFNTRFANADSVVKNQYWRDGVFYTGGILKIN